MIQKSLLLASLCALSLLAEGSLATLKYGLTSIDNDGGFDFSKHSFRVDGTFDRGYIIKPRVGFAYINIDESAAEGGVSSLLQFDIDGLYEIESKYILTPYIFAGAGYEHVVDSRPNFDSQFYLDGGVGVRYPLDNGINLVSELKSLYMLDSGSNQDAEFAFYIGVGIPLGGGIHTAPRDSDGDGVYDYADICPNSPRGSQVDIDGCPLKHQSLSYKDSDGDTIPDSIDICPNTPAGTGVNDRGCPVRAAVEAKPFNTPEPTVLGDVQVTTKSLGIPAVGAVVETIPEDAILVDEKGNVIKEVKADSVDKVSHSAYHDKDGDGVEDSKDQCANTPKGFTVNAIGCEVKRNLNVKFEPNSYIVTASSKTGIKEFAKFVKRYPNAKVDIIGYTDSSGNREKNRVISEKRAKEVKRLLASYGVPLSKMRAIGKGDLNPIATNDTAEGREKNRRVEVEIK